MAPGRSSDQFDLIRTRTSIAQKTGLLKRRWSSGPGKSEQCLDQNETADQQNHKDNAEDIEIFVDITLYRLAELPDKGGNQEKAG